MLVPALLRRRLPRAAIGFFLHIPFPSSEVFRVLPWRAQIIQGILGADLIGFHTSAYVTHFLAAVRHIEGIEADADGLPVGVRRTRVGVFPMSVDTSSFATLARNHAVTKRVNAIRRSAGGRRIVLGIDRLDYTKGILRRLRAIERLLEREPEWRHSLRYIQIAVPSRESVEPYQAFRRQIEEAVGRINGGSGTVRSTPIHYLHRSIGKKELVALFCATDVMLVTPLRDGMNLVAKEFVASRVDEDGVLVLSEFAGAAHEMQDALIVNPYDVDGMSSVIAKALRMPGAERQARMHALRARVIEYDVHRWADSFIRALGSGSTSRWP
jgi:trehalose 6-phosphate synthase/phosphatase